MAYHDLGGTPSPGHITTQRSGSQTVRLIEFSDGSNTGIDFHIVGLPPNIDSRKVDQHGNITTRPPQPGTPAAKLFRSSGINLNEGLVNKKGGTFTFVLSGLDANQRYDIALYGDRNAPSDGVERFQLHGADAATNSSSTGLIDAFTTELETRPNAAAGHVVRWTDIQPGADGQVEIEISTTGVNIAYLSAVRVAQQIDADVNENRKPRDSNQ